MNEFLSVSPEILMGEAGICSFWAMVAVAWVYQRNQRMNGWNGQPNDRARLVARTWWLFSDPTDGARHVFSRDDLKKQTVQQIIKGIGPPKVVFPCQVGQLAFY